MSKLIDVRELAARFSDILSSAKAGDDIIVTQGDKQARLVPISAPSLKKKRIAGKGAGTLIYMSDDFDAPLPDSFWLGEE
jgi:antitoxin (DNA-binding transcriptional repressor) of toxin-antitoxin stability system